MGHNDLYLYIVIQNTLSNTFHIFNKVISSEMDRERERERERERDIQYNLPQICFLTPVTVKTSGVGLWSKYNHLITIKYLITKDHLLHLYCLFNIYMSRCYEVNLHLQSILSEGCFK